MEMTRDAQLMESFKEIIESRGKKALRRAEKEILRTFTDDGVVSEALRYFARVMLHGAVPVFPALISLSCEAVGGKTKKTTSIGTAVMLIASAADIHDDIIDKSSTKGANLTVFGKFGEAIAVLVGDALLIQGFMLLRKECLSLPREQAEAILDLVVASSFEINCAEALETKLRRKFNFLSAEYFEIIRMKAVVPELNAKIGAILGGGTEESVKALGHFGRTYGILSTVIEEFMDLQEHSELQNRVKNECLPLPVLYALQNPQLRPKIISLLEKGRLNKKDAEKIANIVLNAPETKKLEAEIKALVQEEIKELKVIKENDAKRKLEIFLLAMPHYFYDLEVN